MRAVRSEQRALLGLLVALSVQVVWPVRPIQAAEAGALTLVLSADTEGQVGPCATCPSQRGGGGLLARASALRELRAADPGLLLVDAGNALFGPESSASGGEVIRAAYEQLGYDVLNLSFRDFRLGKAKTLELIRGLESVFVSANLLDAESGKLLARPFIVKGSAGSAVALLGVTEAPAGSNHLPHLRAQLGGIRVRPPAEALAEWMPRARSEAARVILIYYGGPGGLEPLLRAHGKDLACVLVGGARPENLPSAASPPVVGTGEHGTQLARVSIPGAGTDGKAELRQVALDPARKDAPEMEAVLSSFEKLATAAAAEEARADAREAASAPSLVPHALEPERSHRIGLSAQNRAVRLTIESAALVSRYGDFESPRGRKLLLLETGWENRIPWTIVQEARIPTEYRIPNLADHLYVVLNGVAALRILPEAADLPGHLVVKDFKLGKIGDRLRGNVLFEVPASPVESLELRFYDFAHGHFQADVIRSGAAPGPGPKPKSPLQRNEVLEVGIFGIERAKEHAGAQAPDGLTFLVVDLRARSLVSVEADATAFDPKARAGAKTRIGTVADWKESRRYSQLVADGEIAFAPLPSSSLTEEPRFLPDVLTGGSLAFLAPEKTVSLELRCDFPNAKSSLDGRLSRPQGIAIPIDGKRPKLEVRKAVLAIQDDVFDVAVTGLTAPGELAGQVADEGQGFLALDVTISNTGKKGEFFQPLEQLKIVLAAGTLIAVDPAALQGVRAPLPLIWIPPGERRSFQAVYRVPTAEAKLRLAYAGVSLQKTLDLPAMERGPAPAIVAKPVSPPGDPAAKRAPEATKEKPASLPEKASPPIQPIPPSPQPTVESRGDAPQLVRTDRKPRGLAGVGLTPEQVNEAIDRGAAFLWGHLKAKDFKVNHYKLGQVREHTIATLALVHAGAHKKFPDFDTSLRAYLPVIDPRRGDIYQAGITCMAVEAYGDPSFLPTLRRAVRYILEVQGAEGSWSYNRNLADNVMSDPAEDRVIQVSGGAPFDGSEAALPTARVTSWKDGVDGDNSVSQYAILGLQAASRSGVPITPEVWQRALASFQSRQGIDGNWGYHTRTSAGYGSMTCAGICSLAITRHELGEKTAESDAAIEKGLVWLGKRFSVSAHPETHPSDRWFYYYLYSLERVGRVLGLDFIGTHEWYPEGARQLLTIQKPDGSWTGKNEEEDPRLATSFALLFLTRSTPSLKAETAKRGGDGILKTGIQLPRGSRYYLILDASGSMLAEMDGKTKWQIAKDAVARLVEDLPETSEVALRVYGHRKRAIDEGASDDTALEIPLRRLVKKDFLAKLESLRPRGKTPMARSLLEAKKDLAGAPASDPVTVILLTDGGEDTIPRQDPLKAAAEFGELNGVRLHLIGFDIGREDWSAQLQAMAQRGQGSYWPALKAESLHAELRSAVFGVPSGFSVLDAAGKEAASGAFGKEVQLGEGRYAFHTSYGGVDYEEIFWVNTDRTTSVVFNAARVTKLKQAPGTVSPGAARPAPAAPDVKPTPQPAAKPKFCSDCGKPLKVEAKFCESCGAKVKG